MSTITLTTTQHAMLDHAIHHTDGRIDWFPENIKGGARQKVLQGLFNRALITPHGSDWLVAAEGFDALGCARPSVCSFAPDPELEAAVAQAEATWAQGVDTNESAPAAQAEPGKVAIETETQVDQHDSATGCDDCISGTDVPATEIDATQGQPLPTAATYWLIYAADRWQTHQRWYYSPVMRPCDWRKTHTNGEYHSLWVMNALHLRHNL